MKDDLQKLGMTLSAGFNKKDSPYEFEYFSFSWIKS